MRIEAIFESIDLATNKNRRGYFKVSQKQTAVRNAIRDLHSELLQSFKKEGVLPDKLRPFRKTATVSFTSGSASLPADFSDIIACQSTVGSNEYEAKIARTDIDWVRRNKADLFKDINSFAPEHWFKKKATIALTSGVGSLPSDYVEHLKTFEAAGKEGNILDEEEFTELTESSICAPSASEPVGRIYANQIEVAPSTITSIDLMYYAFPNQYVPLVRTMGSTIEILPTSIAAGKLHYVMTPTDIVYGTTIDADGRGVSFDAATSTDTEFEDNAINDIVSKALFHLGLSAQYPELTQVDRIKNGNDS